MLSLEERMERSKQIGASEVYKLFNFDTQEAQGLWELKIGILVPVEVENDAITCGNILEEDCLKYYEKTNNKELIFGERIEHKNIKGFVASLDSREKETSIPVENKVINENTWIKWMAKRAYNAVYNDIKLNIPKSYYCQLQAQICVLDVEKGILNINTVTDEEQEDPINVVITDLHNKQLEIYRDQELIEEMLKRVQYMLYCITHKIRPSENDYLEKYVF